MLLVSLSAKQKQKLLPTSNAPARLSQERRNKLYTCTNVMDILQSATLVSFAFVCSPQWAGSTSTPSPLRHSTPTRWLRLAREVSVMPDDVAIMPSTNDAALRQIIAPNTHKPSKVSRANPKRQGVCSVAHKVLQRAAPLTCHRAKRGKAARPRIDVALSLASPHRRVLFLPVSAVVFVSSLSFPLSSACLWIFLSLGRGFATPHSPLCPTLP